MLPEFQCALLLSVIARIFIEGLSTFLYLFEDDDADNDGRDSTSYRHVRRQRRGFTGHDAGQQSDEVRRRHLPGDTRLQCGQSGQKNFQRRQVVAGQQPHVKPREICRDHFP